jgi:hypothetical protein
MFEGIRKMATMRRAIERTAVLLTQWIRRKVRKAPIVNARQGEQSLGPIGVSSPFALQGVRILFFCEEV